MAKKKVFKDRETGLVIFGVIHIIIGAFCVLFMLLTIVGAMALRNLGESSGTVMSVGDMILVVSLFLLIAIWFVWMGIGSIQARKWARALILITSWFWLIGGVILLLFSLLFLPALSSSPDHGDEI